MGDKGGKKDKDKGQKQKASKQIQEAKEKRGEGTEENPVTGSFLEPQGPQWSRAAGRR